MMPEQEQAKLDAERRQVPLKEKFMPPRCYVCKGRGWVLAGRFPTKVTCQHCNGMGELQHD